MKWCGDRKTLAAMAPGRPDSKHATFSSPWATAYKEDCTMSTPVFEKDLTGLLVVDPYNDFISEGGILWPLVKEIAEAVHCVPNMLTILKAARAAGVRVFFAPHHRDRGREDEIEGWKYIAPIQNFGHERRLFEAGAWGGTFRDEFTPLPGEVVAQEHPWWLAPNGNCQNNLETGDVIEGLPNAIKTIHLGGTAYHVQNEALLQWFAGQTPSTAINGAYSYPDPVLTTPSVSRNPGCK